MKEQEAIKILDDVSNCIKESSDLYKALEAGIMALEKQEKYERQYLDDLSNPLEPLKISSALNSQIYVLEYRKEHAPKKVNVLDYTVIYALKECLERRMKDE